MAVKILDLIAFLYLPRVMFVKVENCVVIFFSLKVLFINLYAPLD